jgi:hypothetical protein
MKPLRSANEKWERSKVQKRSISSAEVRTGQNKPTAELSKVCQCHFWPVSIFGFEIMSGDPLLSHEVTNNKHNNYERKYPLRHSVKNHAMRFETSWTSGIQTLGRRSLMQGKCGYFMIPDQPMLILRNSLHCRHLSFIKISLSVRIPTLSRRTPKSLARAIAAQQQISIHFPFYYTLISYKMRENHGFPSPHQRLWRSFKICPLTRTSSGTAFCH